MIAIQFACHHLVRLESFLFNHSVTWAGFIRHLKVHAVALEGGNREVLADVSEAQTPGASVLAGEMLVCKKEAPGHGLGLCGENRTGCGLTEGRTPHPVSSSNSDSNFSKATCRCPRTLLRLLQSKRLDRSRFSDTHPLRSYSPAGTVNQELSETRC